MNEIKDLEINVLSCLLIKPELMKDLVLKDEHFQKHQRLWQFMKAFYNKFQTFDVQLMYSVCIDKWHIVNYITMLIDVEPNCNNFRKYQERLIELYDETKKEKWIIEKIYKLANELYVRSINVETFKNKTDEIFKNAEEIFKEVEK